MYWKLKNNDNSTCKSIELKRNPQTDLVQNISKVYLGLKAKGLISQKELQYFAYEFKKSAYVGKLYQLPKIH